MYDLFLSKDHTKRYPFLFFCTIPKRSLLKIVPMSVRVVIVGYGYVGHQLAQILKKDHHHVTGICRRSTDHACDHLQLQDLMTLQDHDLPDADFVVYCPSSDQRTPKAYQDTYVVGAKHVASIYAQRTHKPRFLYVSSTRVYEQQHGQWVDETSTCAGHDPLAACLLEGEKSIEQAPLEHMIVRASGLYGPGRHYLLDALEAQNAPLCESQRFSNRIHVLDMARMLYHLMRVHYNEGIYIASDHEPTPINTIISWLSATTGHPLPAHTIEHGADPGDTKSNKRLNNARILHTGFRFEFPNYRQGFKHILQLRGDLPPPV
jgi:nucleoside-diphosphate-sugar epimerase